MYVVGMPNTEARGRPRRHVTARLDADIVDWLNQDAINNRRSLSQAIQYHLDRARELARGVAA